jgi:hypothetical protein
MPPEFKIQNPAGDLPCRVCGFLKVVPPAPLHLLAPKESLIDVWMNIK